MHQFNFQIVYGDDNRLHIYPGGSCSFVVINPNAGSRAFSSEGIRHVATAM
jgi:hypothetical protein